MNKAVTQIVIGLILIMLTVSAVFVTYYLEVSKSEDNAVAILVEDGNKAMEDEMYQTAVEKYDAALEYEPENRQLKDAIAHAYIMLAKGMGNTQEAIDTYQKALSYNASNTNAYWGMASIYEENADENNLLLTLQTGYVNTNDTNMKIKSDNIEIERARIQAEEEERLRIEAEEAALEEARNEKLSKVLELFQAEKPDIDAVKELIRSEEYIAFADEVIGADNSFYYGDKDSSGLRSGKGIALYENGYYYYGDFANNVRCGSGIYIRAVYSESSSIGSFVFEGEFSNDKPNGNGTATSNFYKDKISSAELVKQVISGEYVDGLENGTMNLSGTTKSGASVKYTYKAENGVAAKASNEDSGIKGQYVIAKSSDGKSKLSSDGSKRGVEGFIQ